MLLLNSANPVACFSFRISSNASNITTMHLSQFHALPLMKNSRSIMRCENIMAISVSRCRESDIACQIAELSCTQVLIVDARVDDRVQFAGGQRFERDADPA